LVRPNNRINGAGLLTVTAIDAFGHVDVIAGGAAAAIIAWFRLNHNGLGGANRLTQFAGDATLLTAGVTAQGMFAAKA
jgi:hypothetical protein